MELLENAGTGVLFIAILVFAVFFGMMTIIFVFGIPKLYVQFLTKIGKKLETKFPRLAENRKVRDFFSVLTVFSSVAVFVGAIILWFEFIDWLPN